MGAYLDDRMVWVRGENAKETAKTLQAANNASLAFDVATKGERNVDKSHVFSIDGKDHRSLKQFEELGIVKTKFKHLGVHFTMTRNALRKVQTRARISFPGSAHGT